MNQDVDVVREFYNRNAAGEWQRFDRHPVEFEITKRILGKFLPEQPIDIVDIGGGPGRYAFWLAEQGHRVTLFDLAQANLDYAKSLAPQQKGRIANLIAGNALHLDQHLGPAKFDLALLMGPLYHLVTEADRIQAVEQALGALREGGTLVVAFISGYAPILDVLKHNPQDFNGKTDRYLNYLSNGTSIVSRENPGFTNAYFIHPSEIDGFMAPFGLERLGLFTAESILGPFEKSLAQVDAQTFSTCIDLAMRFLEDENCRAFGEHFLYVARKPSSRT